MKNKIGVLLFIWYIFYLYAIISNYNAKVLLLLFTIILPFFLKKIKEIIYIIIILLLGTFMGKELKSIFSFGGLNILDIGIICSLIRVLYLNNKIKKRIEINYTFFDKIFLFYIAIITLSFFIGFPKYGKESLELRQILTPFLFYIILRISNIKYTVEEILKIIFNCVGIYTILILIIYFIGDPEKLNLLDYEGRLAVNITMYILTIPYSIIYLLKKRLSFRDGITILFFLCSEFTVLYFNLNRTVFILMFFSFLSMFCTMFFYTERNKYLNISYSAFLIASIILVLSYILFFKRDFIEPIIARFDDIINKTGSYANLLTRFYTVDYYIPKILTTPFGQGWGAPMVMIDAHGRLIPSEFVDNFFITIGYKTGLIPVLIYILLLIDCLKLIIKRYFMHEKINIIILISFPLIIIASTIFTSQSFHTMSISAFINLIFYCYNNGLES